MIAANIESDILNITLVVSVIAIIIGIYLILSGETDSTKLLTIAKNSGIAGIWTAVVGVITLLIINSMVSKSFRVMINDSIYEASGSYLMFGFLLFIIGFIAHIAEEGYRRAFSEATS